VALIFAIGESVDLKTDGGGVSTFCMPGEKMKIYFVTFNLLNKGNKILSIHFILQNNDNTLKLQRDSGIRL
jgi:hypothetical protein